MEFEGKVSRKWQQILDRIDADIWVSVEHDSLNPDKLLGLLRLGNVEGGESFFIVERSDGSWRYVFDSIKNYHHKMWYDLELDKDVQNRRLYPGRLVWGVSKRYGRVVFAAFWKHVLSRKGEILGYLEKSDEKKISSYLIELFRDRFDVGFIFGPSEKIIGMFLNEEDQLETEVVLEDDETVIKDKIKEKKYKVGNEWLTKQQMVGLLHALPQGDVRRREIERIVQKNKELGDLAPKVLPGREEDLEQELRVWMQENMQDLMEMFSGSRRDKYFDFSKDLWKRKGFRRLRIAFRLWRMLGLEG